MDNDIIYKLKYIAFKNAQSKSIAWFIEQCYRWYSRKYYTPLHEVRRLLTPHEVILMYFEDVFLAMDPEERLKEEEALNQYFNKHFILDPTSIFEQKYTPQEDLEAQAMEDEVWVQEMLQSLEKKDNQKNTPSNNNEEVNLKFNDEIPPEAIKLNNILDESSPSNTSTE